MFDKDILPMIAHLNPTIMWIALTVGLLLYVIGYFAGGKMKQGRILLCTAMVTLIGVLALPVPMNINSFFKYQFVGESARTISPVTNGQQTQAGPAFQSSDQSAAPQEAPSIPVSYQVVVLILYVIWIAFLVAMGIYFYETLVVTTEEVDVR